MVSYLPSSAYRSLSKLLDSTIDYSRSLDNAGEVSSARNAAGAIHVETGMPGGAKPRTVISNGSYHEKSFPLRP